MNYQKESLSQESQYWLSLAQKKASSDNYGIIKDYAEYNMNVDERHFFNLDESSNDSDGQVHLVSIDYHCSKTTEASITLDTHQFSLTEQLSLTHTIEINTHSQQPLTSYDTITRSLELMDTQGHIATITYHHSTSTGLPIQPKSYILEKLQSKYDELIDAIMIHTEETPDFGTITIQ